MKNFTLLLTLISLIGVAYYIDQREGVIELGPKRNQGEKIFSLDLKELREVHLPNVKMKNTANKWSVTDIQYPVDRVVLENVINRLNNIHVLKTIKTDESKINDFFIKQNHFIKLLGFQDEIEVRLGDVSDITGHFYMQVFKNQKGALYLCHDTTFFQGFYKTEVEANLQRYLGFKNLVLLKPFDLVERNIFKDIEPSEVNELSFSNVSGDNFLINFKSTETTPTTPEGIQLVSLEKSFELIKKNIKFEEFIKSSDQSFDKEISRLVIKTVENQKEEEHVFTLYALMDRKSGYYLTYNKSDKVFIFTPKTINFFISSLSDFWVRKLILPKTKFEDSIAFKMSADGKSWYDFEVYDLKEFKIKSLDNKVVASQNISNFNFLFNIVFAQNDFKVSEDLRKITDSEKNELLKTTGLYIELLGKKAFVMKKGIEVYLIDLDENLLYNYIKKTDHLSEFSPNQFFQSKSK